ncbi:MULTISPECIES: cell wall-binding repeat-containing protein [unclassified Ornithinimicrobium]|uniref:cell wall-binding repeat-containing protein n=1 Tax=unclassified Ornithinimicrobium TaxID=2615080 RepID=UPI003854B5CE
MRRRMGALVTAAVATMGLVFGPVAMGTQVVTTDAGVVQAVVDAPTIQDGDLDFTVERHAGSDRYATAAAISRRFVTTGTPVVYVTSGLSYADALSAGPAAGRASGPTLFVRQDNIPSTTSLELKRLQPGRIVVVGGTSVVGTAVADALRSYTAGSVTRLAGIDRFGTSVAVSQATFPSGAATVYVATGRNWPDALSAGAGAVIQAGPVLLTDTNAVPSAVLAEINRLNPDRIMLVGGTIAVSETAAAQLRTIATTERVAGTDRYATALALSTRVFGPDRPGVVVASGETFPDALAAVPATVDTRGPILLARHDSIPYVGELDRLTPRTAHVVGGTYSLSIEVPKAAQRERGVCWAGPDYTGGTSEVLTTVGGTTSKKIAYTLDMGGRLDGALTIVNYLIDNQVCTTFFPTSIMADTTEGRVIMAKIAAHPHLFEIGNHTVHHCDLVNGGGGSPTGAPCQVPMTSTFIRAELTGAEASLLRQTGLSTKPYWRPPYGSYNTFVREQATAVGFPKTVMWARDTIDWDPATTTAQIVARTTSPLPTSGSIVLSHLGGYNTPAALPQIVSILRANGYTMTTVSDMRDG